MAALLVLMIELPVRPAWTKRALCHGVPVHEFFRGRGDQFPEAIAAACRVCPVRAECLLLALVEPCERFGVWGGLAERARRALRGRGVYRSPFEEVVFDRVAGTVTVTPRVPVVSIAEAVEALAPFRAGVLAATG